MVWGAVALLAVYLFGNAGFRDMVTRSQDKIRLNKQLTRLRSEHDRLAKEWSLIQADPTYTEYLIRKNLGYVKKGEVEYRLLTRKTPGDAN